MPKTSLRKHDSIMDISVVIVTKNRAELLSRSLHALSHQEYPLCSFEVIVADNGSTDDTRAVCEELSKELNEFSYICDRRPGQLVGWHRALLDAKGELICFIDDDVSPSPTWLTSIAESFKDPEIGMVTGPIIIAKDCHIPDWIDCMRLGETDNEILPVLGLLNAGPNVREIPHNFAWGSNFSIRKELLIAVGGFHPGAMPRELIFMFGDAEIHVGREVKKLGYKCLYHPAALVEHYIPEERISLSAIQSKFMTSGFSRSFQTLRELKQAYPKPKEEELVEIANRYFNTKRNLPEGLFSAVLNGLQEGISLHLKKFKETPEFRKWVLRENFLDLDDCYDSPILKDYSMSSGSQRDWRIGGKY